MYGFNEVYVLLCDVWDRMFDEIQFDATEKSDAHRILGGHDPNDNIRGQDPPLSSLLSKTLSHFFLIFFSFYL